MEENKFETENLGEKGTESPIDISAGAAEKAAQDSPATELKNESVSENVPESVLEEKSSSDTSEVKGSEEIPDTGEKKAEEKTAYAFRWSYEDSEFGSGSTRKKNNGAKIYALVITAAFLVCFGILAAVLIIDDIANITETKIIENERTIFVREYDSESGVLTVPEIADKVLPSFVSVSITTATSKNVGSGFFLRSDGYIATNAHVVNGAQSIKVLLSDGSEKEAEVIGKDTLADLAVIKIEGEGYTAAELGKSAELLLGETVVAIGTPSAVDLHGSVTVGIISGLNRDIKMYNSGTGALEKTMTVIQTTADMTNGNSGGPLVNDRGEVIGINTMKLAEGYDGVSFAIPIDGAAKILDEIINTGKDVAPENSDVAKKRAVIGIKGGAVSQMDGFSAAGVYVSEIYEGYDAENHLVIGDIIIGINGYEVITIDDISDSINDLDAGDTVELKISRKGKIINVTVELGYEK